MQKLYHNGDIITMENESDSPEAVLIEGGCIKSVGMYEDLKKMMAVDCEVVDLEGKTLMPSFIDGHGHIVMASTQYLANANLENAKDFNDIIRIIQEFIAQHHIPPGEVVVGCLYDHNYLAEKRHPDRKVLDQASSVHPILISHASSHMGVANSMALSNAGIDENTPAIVGGLIERYPETNIPTGYLEETAYMQAKRANEQKISNPEELLTMVQDIYAANGVTTAQEGAAGKPLLDLAVKVSQAGRLKIDIVAYPTAMLGTLDKELGQIMEDNADIVRTYKNHLKIGGYKLVLDGSPQGKSAWMSKPYENSGDYCGYPWLSNDQVRKTIKRALADNQQLLTHCNGDAASEQLLNIYEEELFLSDNPNKKIFDL